VVVSGGSARLVNSILGLLCRKHFPDIVTYASKTEPAYSFDHYAVALDAEYPNKAARVKEEFWVSLPHTTLLNSLHSLDFS
jgi:3-polyprenyl-4-hydroxybenzoate decarboxylase